MTGIEDLRIRAYNNPGKSIRNSQKITCTYDSRTGQITVNRNTVLYNTIGYLYRFLCSFFDLCNAVFINGYNILFFGNTAQHPVFGSLRQCDKIWISVSFRCVFIIQFKRDLLVAGDRVHLKSDGSKHGLIVRIGYLYYRGSDMIIQDGNIHAQFSVIICL